MGLNYDNLVEQAAETLRNDGVLDLVSLAQAGEAGFGISAFQRDVERRAAEPQ